jgi:hypothetical protein
MWVLVVIDVDRCDLLLRDLDRHLDPDVWNRLHFSRMKRIRSYPSVNGRWNLLLQCRTLVLLPRLPVAPVESKPGRSVSRYFYTVSDNVPYFSM